MERPEVVKVWVSSPPNSADPRDYDFFAHHVTFGSVLAGLVTQYRVGETVGQLAETWHASPDFKTWTFTLRKEAVFEDGSAITPDDVIQSWKRIALIQKSHQSQSGFLEKLVGYAELKSMKSDFAGLSASGRVLSIRFVEAFPKLLDTIGFGLYSVVSPKDYDVDVGSWRGTGGDLRKVTASGPYRVTSWSDSEMDLELRKDYPVDLLHARPLKKIRLTWSPDGWRNSDLFIGLSDDIEPTSQGFQFWGAVPSSIAYAYCLSWPDPKSICHAENSRRQLRKGFYDSLARSGRTAVRSFFPLVMSGIQEMPPDSKASKDETSNPLRGREVHFFEKKTAPEVLRASYLATRAFAGEAGMVAHSQSLPASEVFAQTDPNAIPHSLDLAFFYTSILVDDPRADIRFMFLSKEGIRLPDTDGRVHKELEKEDFSPQRINELLWDQAVIWPIGHFAFGIWAKATLDFSLLNLVLPPTGFQWLGWKT